jgi:hypothetical protein
LRQLIDTRGADATANTGESRIMALRPELAVEAKRCLDRSEDRHFARQAMGERTPHRAFLSIRSIRH